LDDLSASTLDRVRQIVSKHSGMRLEKLTANSAIDQDVRISGDDVTELAEALAKEFGEHVWQWPWQRFAEMSEPHMFTVFWFVWRLATWPFRGTLRDSFERLELRHIAAVIDRGEWFEP
jgi:hypothetical protein